MKKDQQGETKWRLSGVGVGVRVEEQEWEHRSGSIGVGELEWESRSGRAGAKRGPTRSQGERICTIGALPQITVLVNPMQVLVSKEGLLLNLLR